MTDFVKVAPGRVIYQISKGGGAMAPVLRWEWVCDACHWTCSDESETVVRKRVKEHACGR